MSIDTVLHEEPIFSEACIVTTAFGKKVVVPASGYDDFQSAISQAYPVIDTLHRLEDRRFHLDVSAQILVWGSMITATVDIFDKNWAYAPVELAAFGIAPVVALASAILYNHGIKILNKTTPPLSRYVINSLYSHVRS